MQTAQIAIVGAGVIGQTLAITLAQRGFSILLIEQRSLSTELPSQEIAWRDRCIALNLENQQLLKQAGIDWNQLSAFCQNYSTMQVWDADSTANIRFSADELYLKSLGCILPTSALSACLSERLQAYPTIQVLAPHCVHSYRLNADSVTVCCESAEYTAQLVVAAEGARSQLRELFGFQMQTWDYQQTAVVATVEVTQGDAGCAYQQFQGIEGPIALLPLPKTNWYSLVWSTTPDHAAVLCAMEQAEFACALKQATTGFFGDITCLTELKQYPLVMHHTKEYFRERCVLVGDSAHSVHPLAGLGMNLGLKDVKVLATVLSAAKQQQRDLADRVFLKQYHQSRYAEVWEVIAFLEVIKRSFSSEHPFMRQLREFGLGFVAKQAWLKKQLMKIAIGTVSG